MYLSIRLSVMCLCRSLNVLTHHCADVPFNWRWPAAALLASSQQACCVLMVQGDHLSAKPGNVTGNLTAVMEMSGILLNVREVSVKKSCLGKVV